jgi:hypothetical protein
MCRNISKINSINHIVEYHDKPERGVWNDMRVLKGWDRLANYVSALLE